jgi:hypothetical protein
MGRNFLSEMVCRLSELYLMPGEEFIRKGDVVRELGFVADGVVQLFEGSEVKKEIRGDIAEQPSIVGDVSFFLGIPQVRISARAGASPSSTSWPSFEQYALVC